jgi:hypothetical protein
MERMRTEEEKRERGTRREGAKISLARWTLTID